ncbi:MAG: hypothetical protein Q9175_005647 [Cornicularia normoerica]
MPLPSSAWAQARERFLEDLEESERFMFAEASLENLFYSASAAQKVHREGSRSRYLASKLNSFLAGIDQYGKALDLSSQFQKYFTALIDMFEQIGDVIPRFQAYETIFSSSPRLLQSLSTAYLDMIKFCTSAKTTFQKARKSVMNAKVLFKISWRPVEQQFATLMKDFRRHRKSVEKEAELAHLLEAEKARAVGRANLQLQEKQNSSMHYCFRVGHVSAGVINTLSQEMAGQHTAVAYFYCDYADYETLDASTILGTIIQQLLVVRLSIEETIAVKIREAFGDGIRKPSPGDLTKILEFIILEYHQCVYIVLDGVDEASPDTQEVLLSNFAKLSTSCSTLLRLYFSTREIALRSTHFPSCLSFNVSENHVAEDIHHYIKASVQQRLHSLPVMFNHPYLEEDAVHELTAKAQGLFLWVSLQVEELCDPSHSERSFKSALQDLPEGLTATYERISQKIARHSIRQKALAEKILEWVVCARRPLRFHELKDAVSVDLDDVAWDRSKISAETDAKRFLFVCGNLVVFHERNSTVRLAHHTVGQFLDEHKRDHSKMDVRIGEICLTYLGFSDFETQVVPTSKNQDLLGAQSSRQAGFYRIPQILGLSNGVYGFILGLYNRNKKLPLPDVNYAELMRRHQKQPLPASLAQKYCLLTYVAENWIWHARSFDPKTSDRWSEFREFVFYKTLPFDFKPWDTLQGPPNLPHLSIYLWALENNHLPLLLLLRDVSGHRSLRPYLEYKTLCWDRVPPHLLIHNAESAGVDFRKYPNAYDWPAMKIFLEGRTEMLELYLQEDPSIISNRHIMTRALMDANLGVVKFFLRGGANLLKTEIDATNALHSASRKGNKVFVKILLDLGADANSRLFQDERGRTPLYEAFLKDGSDDHEHREPRIDPACSTFDTIQLLLDHGADPNVKQIGEETALHKAVGLGEAYVRLLLSTGADVEARNDRQQSILDVAVDVSDQTIDVISEYEVNLEARDSEGQTALLKAVKNHPNDAARVKALIGHGANVHAKDLKGKTVLHHVRSSSDGTLLRFIELGVDVNARDQSGKTC